MCRRMTKHVSGSFKAVYICFTFLMNFLPQSFKGLFEKVLKAGILFYVCLVFLFLFLQSDKEHDEKIAEQRQKQIELIQQLKSQLEDLEIYAYEVLRCSEMRGTSNRGSQLQDLNATTGHAMVARPLCFSLSGHL